MCLFVCLSVTTLKNAIFGVNRIFQPIKIMYTLSVTTHTFNNSGYCVPEHAYLSFMLFSICMLLRGFACLDMHIKSLFVLWRKLCSDTQKNGRYFCQSMTVSFRCTINLVISTLFVIYLYSSLLNEQILTKITYVVKLDVWLKLCSRSDANYWEVIAKFFHSDFIKQQCSNKKLWSQQRIKSL